jgi:hypothetical protein
VHVCRAAIKKINVCNRTDIQAYFGDATPTRGMWRFAGTEKEKSKRGKSRGGGRFVTAGSQRSRSGRHSAPIIEMAGTSRLDQVETATSFAPLTEKTMKYLTILCLSLGLAGCNRTDPYASANGDGLVVDLSACADSPNTSVDPLCHPLSRTQPK